FGMPDCCTFRVSGFGRGFEMRPMNFQSAVPHFWVCSFCRVIAGTVVSLSCFHSACEACLAQCLRGDKLCPLDQVPIEDDVQRVSFSMKKLSMLKVSRT
ncbi:secreted protein, putative, partial [Ixodes scapularis]